MAEQLGVLLVTNRLEHGGAEHMLVLLAEHLLDGPLRPVVVCLKDVGSLGDRLAKKGVTIHADLLRHKFDVRVLIRLRRLIREECIGAVIAVGSGGDRMFWSTLAARWCGVPCYVWSHVFPHPGHLGFEPINRCLYGMVHRFVALGQRHRTALATLEGIPESRTVVIPNGIDVEQFDRPERRPTMRTELGLDDRNIAIAIIANLRADKRHDLFIQAAQILSPRYPSARFYLVGDGPRHDMIRVLAESTGLLDRTLFLLGPRGDVPDLVQAFDILCLCSEWQECLPITMLEGMAAGKPFVAPDTGSLDEALIDRQTGRFLSALSAQALTDTLAELIDTPEQRTALGAAARRGVRERFTARQMARNFERLILQEPESPLGSA